MVKFQSFNVRDLPLGLGLWLNFNFAIVKDLRLVLGLGLNFNFAIVRDLRLGLVLAFEMVNVIDLLLVMVRASVIVSFRVIPSN